MSHRDIRIWPGLRNDVVGALFVGRIGIGVQEVDDDGLATCCQELGRCVSDFGFVAPWNRR